MDIFKTPEELDMTQQEKSALTAVMHQMEAGELVYQPNGQNESFYSTDIVAPKSFNMNAFGSQSSEGKQVGCIGFWMGIEMGLSAADAYNYVSKQEKDTTKLRQLLWGNLDVSLKPDMVAKTIRNFLETGVVDWQVGYLTQDPH